MPALLITLGNPLRRDDGVGWAVAEAMAARMDTDAQPPLTIIPAHQLLPEMAPAISEASQVIFVDASAVSPPGVITCRPVLPDSSAAVSTHHSRPEALLAYAHLLYGVCPPAYLLTVGGGSFATGEALTAEVEAALPAICRHIEDLVTVRMPASHLE